MWYWNSTQNPTQALFSYPLYAWLWFCSVHLRLSAWQHFSVHQAELFPLRFRERGYRRASEHFGKRLNRLTTARSMSLLVSASQESKIKARRDIAMMPLLVETKGDKIVNFPPAYIQREIAEHALLQHIARPALFSLIPLEWQGPHYKEAWHSR